MANPSLTLLGTGTCELQTGRAASSVLIELATGRVVYDFGRGICQKLVERGLCNDDLCHIVLSHFHPDHLSDLIPFLHAARWSRRDPRTRDLHIYGPRGVKVQVMRLLSLFQGDDLAREKHFEDSAERYQELTGETWYDVHTHEILAAGFSLHGCPFHYNPLPPFNNHGLKFSAGATTCALTGDSAFHDAEVNFLRGVDLAVIDAGHLQDEQIIELAALTQARTIVCSHLYRDLDEAAMGAAATAKGYTGKLVIGGDGMTFDL